LENQEEYMSVLTPSMIERIRCFYESGRAYHNWSHIEAMLALMLEFAHLINDIDVFEAMVVFHDIIYDSRRSDNEELSAQEAERSLDGILKLSRLKSVGSGIRATSNHVVPADLSPAVASDIALLCDIDLSILGTEEATFRAYDLAIREEYAWVPEHEWKTGRAAVLRKFLQRPVIYRTPELRDRFETQARKNLAAALDRLAA
jgi:predicted metal-dependent HD superfamily phosphohydrolase